MMQLFADSESLKADIKAMKGSWAKWYDIKQKEYELSQIERRIKWRDYASVKIQCEQYFVDNGTLFDKNTIINETRTMLSRWQTVNEWPHLAAVFLLDHAAVTGNTQQQLQGVVPPIIPQKVDPAPQGSLSPGEDLVKPEKKSTKPVIAPSTKPHIPTTPTVEPKPENVPEILTVQQKIVFKDGAYYLTGPKGNTRRVEVSELLVNLNLPKNAPENLKKSVQIVEDFTLLLDAYISAKPNQKEKYESAVKQVQWLFAHEDVQMWKNILDVTSITGGMFDNFWRTFSNTDLKKVNDAFRIQDESARRLAILNFIRDDFGQSDIVLAKIMEKNGSYFTFPKDEEILRNGDLSAAGLSVSWRQSVEKVIRRAYLEAAGNWNKNYKEYLAQFQAQNPGVRVNEDSARKNNEQLTVLALAKREIMYQKLYNKDLQWELLLAQSIMGATTLGMSDKSWDVSKEIGWMIAMEAFAIAAGVVTAGTATVAINAAMLGRNAYRGAKALEAYNAASKTRRALTTSARILGSGAGFEAGAATTRSYIENGDLTSMHSLEGYAQSVGMMWAMSAIGKLISVGALGRGIQFKEWAGFAKNVLPFTGQVALEGTAIFGTSAVIGSVFFDRRDNWTLEQMAQAMLMATLLKGAGRVSASKNPKWEIEVRQITDDFGNTVKVNGNARQITDDFGNIVTSSEKAAVKPNRKSNPKKAETTTTPKQSTEKPTQVKAPEAVVKNTEAVIAQAASPASARHAVEWVTSSTKKMWESFSTEWLEKMAHKLWISVKWLADQSVGPVFRMVTGNNPGALLSLVNPMGWWGGKASTYWKNLAEHWKHPVRNIVNLTITWERKDGQWFISAIGRNVVFAWGITALDYFAVPNKDANTPESMVQNYYEMVLLWWLGIVLMEIDPIKEWALDVKNWVSDRIQAKPF